MVLLPYSYVCLLIIVVDKFLANIFLKFLGIYYLLSYVEIDISTSAIGRAATASFLCLFSSPTFSSSLNAFWKDSDES